MTIASSRLPAVLHPRQARGSVGGGRETSCSSAPFAELAAVSSALNGPATLVDSDTAVSEVPGLQLIW